MELIALVLPDIFPSSYQSLYTFQAFESRKIDHPLSPAWSWKINLSNLSNSMSYNRLLTYKLEYVFFKWPLGQLSPLLHLLDMDGNLEIWGNNIWMLLNWEKLLVGKLIFRRTPCSSYSCKSWRTVIHWAIFIKSKWSADRKIQALLQKHLKQLLNITIFLD